ncbi:MAG: hypothetical protein ACRDOA_18310 [Streptosporangiaceae bacterium]
MICVFAASLASGGTSGLAKTVENLITPLGFAAFAVCFAVAVLKYRLYEIDRILSRVISYAIITAVLAGVFAGLVLLATQVLPFKAPVAVAASTLAAAALFNPLRRRVQRVVDRRFNRARYDAEAVVAAFTARLRHTPWTWTPCGMIWSGRSTRPSSPVTSPCGSQPGLVRSARDQAPDVARGSRIVRRRML